MKTAKQPTAVYKADDRSEHATPEAAEARNVIVAAAKNLEASVEAVCKAMGDAAVTADGVRLGDLKEHSLWAMRPYFSEWPQVEDIWFRHWKIEVDLERDRVMIVRWTTKGYEHHDINDLYSTENAAIAAQVEACEAKIDEQKQKLAALTRKLLKR